MKACRKKEHRKAHFYEMEYAGENWQDGKLMGSEKFKKKKFVECEKWNGRFFAFLVDHYLTWRLCRLPFPLETSLFFDDWAAIFCCGNFFGFLRPGFGPCPCGGPWMSGRGAADVGAGGGGAPGSEIGVGFGPMTAVIAETRIGCGWEGPGTEGSVSWYGGGGSDGRI